MRNEKQWMIETKKKLINIGFCVDNRPKEQGGFSVLINLSMIEMTRMY